MLRLGGRRTETAFMKMHNVVSDVSEWLKREHETTSPTVDELAARFEEAWRSKARQSMDMRKTTADRQAARRLPIESRSRGAAAPAPPISLGWAEGEILVSPDGVAHGAGGRVTVRRVKTGKQRSNAFDDIEYTVLNSLPSRPTGRMRRSSDLPDQRNHPANGNLVAQAGIRREKLQTFLQAMQAGQFPAKPEARSPRCPSFFLCGDLPGGAWVQEKL
ncbi:MAG: hypothetical protein R3E92_00255 [Burkholderiaceae bacterium]